MATKAKLSSPDDVAVDSEGNLYIADTVNDRIRKVTTAGIITTVAGNGITGYSGDGGLAKDAQLNGPGSLAVGPMDDLYFLDDRQIRKITAAGIITTVAGNGTGGYSGDGGLATAAQLSVPWGVAVDLAGNLYIADRLNHRIRKVSAAGIITTVAGEGITGDSCIISDPSGVAVDASGNLYISNRGNPQICKVTPSGLISAVAGVAGYLNKGFEGDGGLATRAKISGPEDVAVDSEGNLFIADWQNQRIRKIAQ